MPLLTVVDGRRCIDTSLLTIDRLRAYFINLQRRCTLKPQEDQCLAYVLLEEKGQSKPVQLFMPSNIHVATLTQYDERRAMARQIDGATSMSWITTAQYDELLQEDLRRFLQLDPPFWLVWPRQPSSEKMMEYSLGTERVDRNRTPLQSTWLEFDSITPSPPLEGDGLSTQGSQSETESCNELGSPELNIEE